MRTLTASTILATLLLSATVFAEETPAAASAPAAAPVTAASEVKAAPAPVLVSTRTNTFNAQVLSIDLKRREVALRDSQGENIQFLAGTEIRNLQDLHVGDQVTARASKTIVMQLNAVKGAPMTSIVRTVDRTPKGQSTVFEREIRFVAEVMTVDARAGVINFKGVADHIGFLSVDDPAKLAGIKVGDLVEGLLVQSVEIGVVPPQAPKTKRKTQG